MGVCVWGVCGGFYGRWIFNIKIFEGGESVNLTLRWGVFGVWSVNLTFGGVVGGGFLRNGWVLCEGCVLQIENVFVFLPSILARVAGVYGWRVGLRGV